MVTIRAAVTCCLLVLAPWQALAADNVAKKSLARDALCTTCHDEMEAKPILSIYQTRHGVKADKRAPTCQDCHGESAAHANTPQKARKFPLTDTAFGKGSAAAPQNQRCLTCHQSDSAKHWVGSQHERQGLACTSCHTSHAAHDPVLQRASQAKLCYTCHQTERTQFHLPSAHPVASGKQTCSDCHSAHGGHGPKLLIQDATNDTCFTCHAEKRGPYLWEHAPVSDDCTLCHSAHGSTNRPLLKVRGPWLCQQCHSSSRHPSTAYSATSGANTNLNDSLNRASQLPLHGCANCHSQVHGSNHPGGSRFLR